MVSQQRGGDRWGRDGLGGREEAGTTVWASGGGGKGGAVGSGQESRGEQPHSRGRRAGQRRVWRGEGEGPRYQLPPRRNGLETQGAHGLRDVGHGGRFPPVSHPKAGLCAPGKKGSRGSPAPSPLSPDSDDAAATPPALLVPGAQGTSGRGGLSEQCCALGAMPWPGCAGHCACVSRL